MIIHNELARMWIEATMPYFEFLFHLLLQDMRNTMENP